MHKETFEAGCYYHIYNRGNNKEDIFIEDKNYNFFLLRLKKYILQIADVYAYCLLKNHFHIVLRVKSPEDLPDAFKNKIHLPFSNFFNAYAKSINTTYGRSGSLFQEHLQRNKIDNEVYLKQVIVYVHLNPLKHKFSDNFKSYSHSSFLSYLSDKPTSIDRKYILELFGGKENFEFCHNESQIKYENVVDEIDKMDDF